MKCTIPALCRSSFTTNDFEQPTSKLISITSYALYVIYTSPTILSNGTCYVYVTSSNYRPAMSGPVLLVTVIWRSAENSRGSIRQSKRTNGNLSDNSDSKLILYTNLIQIHTINSIIIQTMGFEVDQLLQKAFAGELLLP